MVNVLLTILPIASLLWLASGFLYTDAYYGMFGINANDFFTIQDYINANISTLTYFIIGVGIGQLNSAAYVHSATRFRQTLTANEDVKFMNKGRAWLLVLLGFTILIDVHLTFTNQPQQYIFHLLVFSFAWTIIIARASANNLWAHVFMLDSEERIKEIQLALAWMPTLIVTFILLGKFWGALILAEKSERNTKAITYLHMSEPKTEQLVFIGSNSRFYFLYNHITNTVEILPSDQVIRISWTLK